MLGLEGKRIKKNGDTDDGEKWCKMGCRRKW